MNLRSSAVTAFLTSSIALPMLTFSARAEQAESITSSCDGISITDPSRGGMEPASVHLSWSGTPRDGTLTSTAADDSFAVHRKDGAESRIDSLTVKILKKVHFETVRNEFGMSVTNYSTYKIRITSDDYFISTEVIEGDIATRSKSATRIVVCRETKRSSAP